jgi:hypothetical protein
MLFNRNLKTNLKINLKTNLKLSVIVILFSSLLSVQAIAFSLHCKSEVLTFLDNSAIELSAQMPSPATLTNISFQLGSDASSALKILGPVNGVKSRSQKIPNVTRFDISDAKSDDVELYLPVAPAGPSFTGLIRVSFDGGYPLEKKMFCSISQN